MYKNWCIVGLSGVTCSGKTTTAHKLLRSIKNPIKIISQDDYFKDENSPNLKYVPDLKCYNWDSLTSLEMNKMLQDIRQLLQSETNMFSILIIEGFSILNFEPIKQLCDLKIYLLLDFNEARDRRKLRTYQPPDKPNYFEKCAWPQHLKHFNQLKQCPERDVCFLDVTHLNTFNAVSNYLMESNHKISFWRS